MPFVRFVFAKYNKEQKEETWHIYMAESVRLIGENKYLTKSYIDLIEEKPHSEYEDMTGDEIALAIIEKAGLKIEER